MANETGEPATPASNIPQTRKIEITLDKATVEQLVDRSANPNLFKAMDALWAGRTKEDTAKEFGVKVEDLDNHTGMNELKRHFIVAAKRKYPQDNVKVKFTLRYGKAGGGGRKGKVAFRTGNAMSEMLARLV